MKKVETIKAVAVALSSIGVGAIVSNLVKATTPSNTKLITKACIAIGSLALCGLCGEAAGDYVEGRVDDTVDSLKGIIAETK